MRPFLKWPGNKYRILSFIKEVLPQGSRLIEPFAGSAAVSLNTDYPKYLLADTNSDLINLYSLLKKQPEDIIQQSKKIFVARNNKPERYYKLRLKFNESHDLVEKACLLIYLNRHGYNGLCRYNKNNIFNVPFGRYPKPYFPEEELWHFVQKSKHITLKHADFKKVMLEAKPGDVIYCDPPYVPLSLTSNFTQYTKQGFLIPEQLTLAQLAMDLSKRNIPVIISNHVTDFTIDVYSQAKITRFPVRRNISCLGHKRKEVEELLAVFS